MNASVGRVYIRHMSKSLVAPTIFPLAIFPTQKPVYCNLNKVQKFIGVFAYVRGTINFTAILAVKVHIRFPPPNSTTLVLENAQIYVFTLPIK